MKNSLESFKSRLNHAEERISDLEDRTLEIIQSGKKKEWDSEESLETYGMQWKKKIHIMGIPEGEEKEKMIESIFKAKWLKISQT